MYAQMLRAGRAVLLSAGAGVWVARTRFLTSHPAQIGWVSFLI
jgi:hypothetical protein